ncbi:hypothetical protein V5O48_011192 [Marasmius crinis-equi]|uniref:Ataxin-2 C-terminal domain-containing protein n=1 Tax=Marasmius crinis-equi TaxID=585013 RepID=A0ABR3F6N9_9AGAR
MNPGLVGVQAAMSVVGPYEVAVGIEATNKGGHAMSEACMDLSREVDEKAVVLNQKKWRELMEELSRPVDSARERLESGLAQENPSELGADSGAAREIANADHNVSLLPGLDLALWDRHGPLPTTPKPHSLSLGHAAARSATPCGTRSCTLTPVGSSPSHDTESLSSDSLTEELLELKRNPTPPLSFSTDSSPKSVATSPSPPLSDFVFPSLGGRSLPKIHLEKDDQGFFTAFEDNPPEPLSKLEPPALLPPFLIEETPKRKSNPSKTRTIVDRLKLNTQRRTGQESEPTVQSTDAPKPRSRASGEGDGCLGLGEPYQPDISRAERKRELFLALNKHQRTDSKSSNKAPPEPKSNQSSKKEAPSTPSSSLPGHVSNDGWIEFKQPPQPRQHNRSRSQNKRTSPQQSVSNNTQLPPHTAPPAYTTFRPLPTNMSRPPHPAYYYPNQPMPPVMPVPVSAVPQVNYHYPAYPPPPQPMVVAPAPYATPYPMVGYPVHQHLRPTTAAVVPSMAGGKSTSGYAAVPAYINRPTPTVGAMHPTVW